MCFSSGLGFVRCWSVVTTVSHTILARTKQTLTEENEDDFSVRFSIVGVWKQSLNVARICSKPCQQRETFFFHINPRALSSPPHRHLQSGWQESIWSQWKTELLKIWWMEVNEVLLFDLVSPCWFGGWELMAAGVVARPLDLRLLSCVISLEANRQTQSSLRKNKMGCGS